MFQLEEIIIYKAIIHTLNKYEEEPRCASYEIDHEEELTHKLLGAYLEKLMLSNQMKWASFGEESEVEAILADLEQSPEHFVAATQTIAEAVHKRLYQYQDYVPSCDLACVLFEMENVFYFGLLKLNHKSILVRAQERSPGGTLNLIKKSSDLYLQPRVTIEEGMIVHLPYMEIALIDKEYKIEGENQSFLADIAFNLNKGRSEKEKLAAFNQINKRLQEKFVGEDLDQRAQIKKAISDTLVENGVLDVAQAIENAFEDGQEIKYIYKEAMGKAQLDQEKIQIDQHSARKKFDVQKISTSTGIEISIPVEYWNDESKVEVVSNSDGTITFILKGIEDFVSS